jgi:hypothetical protein
MLVRLCVWDVDLASSSSLLEGLVPQGPSLVSFNFPILAQLFVMSETRMRGTTRATKEGRTHDRSDTNYQQGSCVEHIIGSKDGPDHQMPSLRHHERRGCKRLNPESQQMGEDSKRHH